MDNKGFEEYLEKYCIAMNVTKEEAIKHKVIKEVKAYYAHKDIGVVKTESRGNYANC